MQSLLKLPEMSRIFVRSTTGVFEVSLVAVHEDTRSIEVLWDEGIKREFSWSAVLWKTDFVVGQKPSVAAPGEQRIFLLLWG